jgi:hypothetical protein
MIVVSSSRAPRRDDPGGGEDGPGRLSSISNKAEWILAVRRPPEDPKMVAVVYVESEPHLISPRQHHIAPRR